MVELDNCPFCGGAAKVFEDPRFPIYGLRLYGECLACGIRTPNKATDEEVKIAWNRRNK